MASVISTHIYRHLYYKTTSALARDYEGLTLIVSCALAVLLFTKLLTIYSVIDGERVA